MILYRIFQNKTVRTPCLFLPQGFSTADALLKGLYVVHIRDWMSVFPRDQFLLLETEEARHRPDYTLQRIMEFLETGNISRPFLFICLIKGFNTEIT